MSNRFVITFDQDVELPAIAETTAAILPYQRQLSPMRLGESFFIENGEQRTREINMLIRGAFDNGLFLRAVATDSDSVYFKPGVRLWRVVESDCDWPFELDAGFRNVAAPVQQEEEKGARPTEPASTDDARFWKNTATRTVWTTRGEANEEELLSDGDTVEITKEAFDELKVQPGYTNDGIKFAPTYMIEPGAKVRYWIDNNCGVTYRTTRVPTEAHSQLVEISEEEWAAGPDYTPHHGIFRGPSGVTYWRQDKTGEVARFATPLAAENPQGWRQVDQANWMAYRHNRKPILETTDGATWWRRSNGTCTEVPAGKLQKAMTTTGARQITYAEYQAWQAAQQEEEL